MLEKKLSMEKLWFPMLSSINAGVIATDDQGSILFFNSVAQRLSEWQESEVLHTSANEILFLLDSQSKTPIHHPLQEVLHSGKEKKFLEVLLVDKNNSYKQITITMTPIFDELGVMLGTVNIFHEIMDASPMQQIIAEQNNLSNIFQHAPVGIIYLNEKTLITKANDVALGFLGSTLEQCSGKQFGDAFFCKESLIEGMGCGKGVNCPDCVIAISVKRAIELGISTSNFEMEKTFVINQVEKKFWLRASVTPMVFETHRQAILVLVDITDSKKRETEFMKMHDDYRKIFDSFPLMIWKSNASMEIEYMNEKCMDFLSVNSKQFIEKMPNVFQSGNDEHLSRFIDDFKHRRVVDDIIQMRDRNQENHWLRCVYRPIYDNNDVFDGYIGTLHDITDIKIAETGLKRYQMLTEHVRDIIFFMDTQGSVIDANLAALESYGYSKEEFLKLNLRELRADCEQACDILKKAEQGSVFYQTTHTRKNKSTFPIEISLQGSDIDGQIIIVGIARDITGRMLAEQALLDARLNAENANRSKSEFLANMSHEIRTPLNGIVGMVDLTMQSELSADQKENLITVKKCSDRLLTIINDILDFSKMEAGKLAIEHVNFDVKAVVEECIKLHSHLVETKQVDLHYAFSSKVPQYLIGDPARLSQILNNLLGNAIKFTEHGEVWVKCSVLSLSESQVQVEFMVQDTGIGIAENNLEVIFKTFNQVDSSFTKLFNGTGLGLAISRQLTEMMGGNLLVKSDYGSGSTFYFDLMFGIGQDDPVKLEPVREKVKEKFRILLTEDDLVNQKVLVQLLKNKGYQVDTARNGQEALEILDKKAYDVILMDIQMPIMDGIEATKRIRVKESELLCYTPIIAITAYALKGDREKFLAHGMDEYLAKPIKPESLFEVIETCLSLKKYNRNVADFGIVLDESGDITFKRKIGEINCEDAKETELLNEVEHLIDSLDEAVVENDIALIEVFAHSIKGLANQIGIEELKTLAFKIELAARRGNFEQTIEKSGAIRRVFEVYKHLN